MDCCEKLTPDFTGEPEISDGKKFIGRRNALKRLAGLATGIIFVSTHDLEEALTVSDTIYLLSQGPRARILASYDVKIPRPRNILTSRKHPNFTPLLEQLWQDMSDAMNSSELGAIR